MANTKPVGEIIVSTPDKKEQRDKLKANHAAFNQIMKGILTTEQFQKYLITDAEKYKS